MSEDPPKGQFAKPPARKEDFDLQINLRLTLDEVASVEAVALRQTRPSRLSRQELCRLACRLYDARRARDRFFDRTLLGEPAWDMLLGLYCLPSRGELLTVSSLSLAADASSSTGIRWQRALIEEGLMERGPSIDDGRRIYVKLTKKGRSLMEEYLTRLYYCTTPMPPGATPNDD